MTLPRIFPAPLQAFLLAHGTPSAVTSLRGLSRNQVWRVAFAGASLIVKQNNGPTEAHFYHEVAPALLTQGIALPMLHWLHTDDRGHWLVLEDIPHQLPRERWLADADVLALLARLHRCSLSTPAWPTFKPGWTEEMTEATLTLVSEPERSRLRPQLQRLQVASQFLFQPLCWISGDPNVMNWGLRADGTAVLFDWERFGRGSPALDLAISIPGMGDGTAFAQVAEGYLRAAKPDSRTQTEVEQLSESIALAKVWNLVEFLSMAAAGQVAQPDSVAWLVEQLPGWLGKMGDWGLEIGD